MKEIKPFKTIDEQIDILLDRGLAIDDREKARRFLSDNNYYRISGYSLTLRKDNTFYTGTSIDNIIDIYRFDAKLRTLIFALLEEIEITVRTHIGYHYGKDHGPLGYLNKNNFFPKRRHEGFLAACKKAIEHNGAEAFVKHHIDEYGGKLPIWVLVETFSFGTLSKLFSALPFQVQKQIRKHHYPNVPKSEFIASWLHSLTVLRNVCAHRGRLYNRKLAIPIPFMKEDRIVLDNQDYPVVEAAQSLFGYLLCMRRLITDKHSWKSLIDGIQLISMEHPFVLLTHYGFPDNWKAILE